MQVKVLFFASLQDFTKIKEMEVENCETKSELKLFISEAYPGIEKISFAISVNRIINPANELLTDGDEVALLPPFSGG